MMPYSTYAEEADFAGPGIGCGDMPVPAGSDLSSSSTWSPVAGRRSSSLLLFLPRPPRRDSPQQSTFMRVDGAVIPLLSLSPPPRPNTRTPGWPRARRNRHRRRDQGRHDARPIPPVEFKLRLSRDAGKPKSDCKGGQVAHSLVHSLAQLFLPPPPSPPGGSRGPPKPTPPPSTTKQSIARGRPPLAEGPSLGRGGIAPGHLPS
jgi:hypothetical protein